MCVCVTEKKERGKEIGRVYSTVSSYQIRVKRYFYSLFSNLLEWIINFWTASKMVQFVWLFRLISPERRRFKVGTHCLLYLFNHDLSLGSVSSTMERKCCESLISPQSQNLF